MDKTKEKIEELDKEFNEVLDKRTKGLFQIDFDSTESIHFLRKILKNKIPFTGGEALSLVSLTDKVTNQEIIFNTIILDDKVNETKSIEVPIFSIELDALHVQNLSYFLNKYTSVGAINAKPYIKAIVPVINASNKLQALDAQLREIQGKKDKINVEGLEEIPLKSPETIKSPNKKIKAEVTVTE
jgi:hypothetical protein